MEVLTLIMVITVGCFINGLFANEEFDIVTQEQSSLKTLMTRLNENMDRIHQRLVHMDNRFNKIEQRLDVVEQTEEPTWEDEDKVSAPVNSPSKQTTYQFSAFVCISEIAELSCADSRTIFVVSAIYGQYNYACTDTCCPPHPVDDCSQDVAETRPTDWLGLKALCDNQTSCEYQYLGVVISNCTVDYLADYIRIFYTCLPEDFDAPVGFTAIPTADKEYDVGELVIFESPYSNFGGHYQADNSIFICPFDGLYLFSVGVLSANGHLMSAELRIDNNAYFWVYADNAADTSNYASGLMFEFCGAGSQVWVRTKTNNCKIRGANRHSLFSAYLIHRY